jgi:hypothetical protein
MTIDDSSDVVIANSGLTLTGPLASFTATEEFPGGTPATGLLLDAVPFTSVGQRDSDAIIQVGQAHDGAVSRSTRWKWFVDVTNNSANSTLRLQHSIAGQAFIDHLLVDQTGSLILARTSPRLFFGDSLDVILRRDTEGNGELGFRNGTNPQVFNIYNTFTADANNEFGEIGWKPVSNTFVIGTVKGSSGGTARPMVLRTDELNALVIDTSQNVTITNDLIVSGAGPHSIAGVTSGAIQLLIGSTFTSDGSSDIASGIFHTPAIVGAAGDTAALTGTTLTAGITTQTATESIANIAQLQVNEPFITDNLTGLITQASTVLITGAPTEGASNDALRVADGRVFLGGQTIIDHDSSATFIVRKDGDAGDVLSVNTVSDRVTIEGGLFVEGALGSSFGSIAPMVITSAFTINTTFTAGINGTASHALDFFPSFTGATGNTTALSLLSLDGNISTQTATESIANISTMVLNEPSITDNLTGSITDAQTLLIVDAPTEGNSNWALRVASGDVLLGGNLTVSGIGPHSIGGSPGNHRQLRLAGNFVSGGQGSSASNFHMETDLTGFSGDTQFLAGFVYQGAITTQADDGVASSITNVSGMRLDEPFITDNLTGGGVITNAQTLLITNAPAEGVDNYALRVIAGATFLGGELEHAGSTLGFFGTTPATQPAAYTRNATIVEDRTLLASASATTLNNNNVLAALIADLQSLGLIQ